MYPVNDVIVILELFVDFPVSPGVFFFNSGIVVSQKNLS